MIIRLQDRPSQPWKNGLGRTRELAIYPSAASSDDFLWRVSIAEVDSDAPFSVFPGIDRQIALLDGDGFTMTLDDERTHALTRPLVPFGFPGEAEVRITLTGGRTRDFNLMIRRNRARGDVLAWHGSATHLLDPTVVLVFCVHGTIDTVEGQLHEGDAWCPSSYDTTVILDDGALALAVFVEPHNA
ncbi:MAG: HutD family protein [Rhodanobacter sp.]